MKKIGLVSYYRDPNYGTMLQAYALSKVLSNLGYENEYINYSSNNAPKWYSHILFLFKRFMKIVLRIHRKGDFAFFQNKEFKIITDKFQKFYQSYIPESENRYYYDTIISANDKYDYFIVGSDQTWSQFMNKDNRTINFLSFVTDNLKKGTYAPSIGSINIAEDFKQKLKIELSTFNSLSCRERENCLALQALLNKEVRDVLDPTLLLNRNDWDQIEISTPNMPEKYVLAYILGSKTNISDYAEQLGHEKGWPVYYILTRPDYLNKKNVLDEVGPAEFVGLIKRASCVITDSFHGTLFSINYNVPFYSFSKRKEIVDAELSNDNARILLFLKTLNLGKRFVLDSDEFQLFEDISYKLINENLKSRKKVSIEYLNTMLR